MFAFEELAARVAALDETLLVPALVLAGFVLLALLTRGLVRGARRLSAPEVQERVDSGMEFMVLDVRSEAAFDRGHIRSAVNLPLSGLRAELSTRGEILPMESDHPLIVVAEATPRAERVADRLRRAGYQRVHVLDGGMRGWQADRLPLASGGSMAAIRH